jgi:uncharacterized protein YjbI with pentapeptide repeats
MIETTALAWETCVEADANGVGCDGVRLATGDHCLAHAGEQDVGAELERLGNGGILDARRVPISGQLLDRLLAAAPRDDDGQPILKAPRFEGAVFRGQARFNGVTFQGKAEFSEATFEGDTSFKEATFRNLVNFSGAVFQGRAGFGQVTFRGDAWFLGTIFRDWAGFGWSTFHNWVGLGRATFEDEARFDGVTFEKARQLGPMLVRKQLGLDHADFKQLVQIQVGAPTVCGRRAQFPAGVQMRLRWASVVLEDADLAAPSILTGAPPFPGLHEAGFARSWARLPPARDQQARPRLLSVCRANLAGLTVSGVDLSACRFLGAHNMDRLRIEGQPILARARGRHRTGRLTLAEEHHWRQHASRRGHGWCPPACEPPAWAKPNESSWPNAAQLVGLYRELRKGREDSKDEPGAADFYYGEMEMRRHAAPRWSVERMLLTLYWLVSGYALRAWRAFATLLLVIVAAAALFATVGFKPPESPRLIPVGVTSTGAPVYRAQPVPWPPALRRVTTALGYSAEVATSLLRGPERPVTAAGELTQATLRWLGPVLLGLALISLRGRVKR